MLTSPGTTYVTEGEVKLIIPAVFGVNGGPHATVFFNPKMEFSRDLSVLAVQVFQRKGGVALTICDALAGIGSKGIRLMKEVSGVEKVVMNDLNPAAVEFIRRNVELNELSGRAEIRNLPANRLLEEYARPLRRLDYVDVDPFGSPTPFIDSTVRAVRSGGMISITATDLAPLSGVYPKACLRKYGGIPLRTEYSHETAIRIVIAALVRHAAVHGVAADPLLSYYRRHYLQVYASLRFSLKSSDRALGKLGFIAHCEKCLNRRTIKNIMIENLVCGVCGSKFRLAGPLWLGPLSNAEFLGGIKEEVKLKSLKCRREIDGLIDDLIGEREGPPTFFLLDKICSRMKVALPKPGRVIDGLASMGYKAVKCHFHRNAIKTDAGIDVVEDLVKEAPR